jgi:hypothetical protein
MRRKAGGARCAVAGTCRLLPTRQEPVFADGPNSIKVVWAASRRRRQGLHGPLAHGSIIDRGPYPRGGNCDAPATLLRVPDPGEEESLSCGLSLALK